MKKIILSVALSIFTLSVFAQKKELSSAISNYEKYKLMASTGADKAKLRVLLDEAKMSSDKAIEHEKTKNLSELWINRAQIISARFSLDSPSIQQLDEKLASIKESFVKAKETDLKNKNAKDLENAKNEILIYLSNGGAVAYNNKDFGSAYKLFNEITVLNPQDTTGAYLNAGVSARQANNIDGMISAFQNALKLDEKNAQGIYAELINANLQIKKDTTAAVKFLEEASKKYPDNLDLIKTKAQIYMSLGQTDKAMTIIDQLIIKEPSNPLYQIIKGQTFLNSAFDLQSKKNKLPDSDKAGYQKLDTEMKNMIDKSLPFYEKAYSLDNKSESALEGLKIIYNFKNDEEKYKEIKAKLDALSKSN